MKCDINNIIARFKDNGFADVPQADASNRFSMSRRLLIFTRRKISSKMPRQFSVSFRLLFGSVFMVLL